MANAIMTTFDGVKIHHMADKVHALNIRNGVVAPQLVINVTDDQRKNCKHFSTQLARKQWLDDRNEFIDYVLSFYGEGEIYSNFFNPVMTRDDVMFITNAIDKVGEVDGHTGSYHIDQADSFSRELVRDYMFLCRGESNVEYSLVKKWFGINLNNKVCEHEFLMSREFREKLIPADYIGSNIVVLKKTDDYIVDYLKSFKITGVSPLLNKILKSVKMDTRMFHVDSLLSLLKFSGYDYSEVEDDIKDLVID